MCWSHKIVGGDNAQEGQIPYQLQILVDNRFHCGATLAHLPVIGNYLFAVTAAHCLLTEDENETIIGISSDQIKISGGSVDRLAPTQTVEVEKVVVHPNYNDITTENDVALIFFKTPFDLDANIQPVELDNIRGYNGNLVVSGWGDTIQMPDFPCDAIPDSTETSLTRSYSAAMKTVGGTTNHQNEDEEGKKKLSTILQFVEIPVFLLKECQDQYATISCGVFSDMICAGGESKDSCLGDSGGPSVGVRDGIQVLVGIVSWGYGMQFYI